MPRFARCARTGSGHSGPDVSAFQYRHDATKAEDLPYACSREVGFRTTARHEDRPSPHPPLTGNAALPSLSAVEPVCQAWKRSNPSFPSRAVPQTRVCSGCGAATSEAPGDQCQLVVSVVSLDGRVLAAYTDGSVLLLHRNIRCCTVFRPPQESTESTPGAGAAARGVFKELPPSGPQEVLPEGDRPGQLATRGRGFFVSRLLCSCVTDPGLRTRIGHTVSLRNRLVPRIVRAEDHYSCLPRRWHFLTSYTGHSPGRSDSLFTLSKSSSDSRASSDAVCSDSIRQEPFLSTSVLPETLGCCPSVAARFRGCLKQAQREFFSLSKCTGVQWPCLSASGKERVLSLLHIALQCVLKAVDLALSRSSQERHTLTSRYLSDGDFLVKPPTGTELPAVETVAFPVGSGSALQPESSSRLLQYAKRQLQAVQVLFKPLSDFAFIQETGVVVVNGLVTRGIGTFRAGQSTEAATWSAGGSNLCGLAARNGRGAAQKGDTEVSHKDTWVSASAERSRTGPVWRGWHSRQQRPLEVCLLLHPSARFVSTKWPVRISTGRTVVPLHVCSSGYDELPGDEPSVHSTSVSPCNIPGPRAACCPVIPVAPESCCERAGARDGVRPWSDAECLPSPSSSAEGRGGRSTSAELALAYAYEVHEQVFSVSTAASEQLWSWPLQIALLVHASHQLQEMIREFGEVAMQVECESTKRHSEEAGNATRGKESRLDARRHSLVRSTRSGSASFSTPVQRNAGDTRAFSSTAGQPPPCGDSSGNSEQLLKSVHRRAIHVGHILNDLSHLCPLAGAATSPMSRGSRGRKEIHGVEVAGHYSGSSVTKSTAPEKRGVPERSLTEVLDDGVRGRQASRAVRLRDWSLVSVPLPPIESAPVSPSDLGGWNEEPPLPFDVFLELVDQIALAGRQRAEMGLECRTTHHTWLEQWQQGPGGENYRSGFRSYSGQSSNREALLFTEEREGRVHGSITPVPGLQYLQAGGKRLVSHPPVAGTFGAGTGRKNLECVLPATISSQPPGTRVVPASGLERSRRPSSAGQDRLPLVDVGAAALSPLVCVVPSAGTIFFCPASIARACVSCACFCVSAGHQILEQNSYGPQPVRVTGGRLPASDRDNIGQACCCDSVNISESCLWVPFRPCTLSDFKELASESLSGDNTTTQRRESSSALTGSVHPYDPSQHPCLSEAQSTDCPEWVPRTEGFSRKSSVCWSLLGSPASPSRRTVALQWLPLDRQQGTLYTLLSAAEFLVYTQLVRLRHSGIVATLLLEGACALTPGALDVGANEDKAASAIAEAIPEVVAALQEVDGLCQSKAYCVQSRGGKGGGTKGDGDGSTYASGQRCDLQKIVTRGGEEALRVIFEILSVEKKRLFGSCNRSKKSTAESSDKGDSKGGSALCSTRGSPGQSTGSLQAQATDVCGTCDPSTCEEDRTLSCVLCGSVGRSPGRADAGEANEATPSPQKHSNTIAAEGPPLGTDGASLTVGGRQEDRSSAVGQTALSCLEVDIWRWLVQGVGEFVLTKKILAPPYASALRSAFTWVRAVTGDRSSRTEGAGTDPISKHRDRDVPVPLQRRSGSGQQDEEKLGLGTPPVADGLRLGFFNAWLDAGLSEDSYPVDADGAGEQRESASRTLFSNTRPQQHNREKVIPEYYCLRGTIAASGLCAAVHFSAVQQTVLTGESEATSAAASGFRNTMSKKFHSPWGSKPRASRVPVACQMQRAGYGRPPHIRSRQQWTVLLGCSQSDGPFWRAEEEYPCGGTAGAFAGPGDAVSCRSDVAIFSHSTSPDGPHMGLEESHRQQVTGAPAKTREARAPSTGEERLSVSSDPLGGSFSCGPEKYISSLVANVEQVNSRNLVQLTAVVITHVSVTRYRAKGPELLRENLTLSDIAALLSWAKEAQVHPWTVSDAEYQCRSGECAGHSQTSAGCTRRPSTAAWQASDCGCEDTSHPPFRKEAHAFVEPGLTVAEDEIREAVAAVLDCLECWRQQRDAPAAAELFSDLSREVLDQSRRIDERLHRHWKRRSQKRD